jgi:colicin import membrane protein
MKKVLLGMFVMCFIFLSGCGSQSDDVESSSSASNVTVSSKEQITISLRQPTHDLENNKFSFSGKTEPKTKLKLYIDNTYLETLVSNDNGEFSYESALPSADDRSYRVEADDSTQSVLVKSKKTLELEAMSEQERKEAEEKENARKEAIAKEEQKKKEAKEAEERKQREAEAKKQEEENNRIKSISNASREYQNAVSKAEDYLDYTAFSKSGLKEQLIFEQFPEDAAQFAVDHIVVNWNEQALQKAKDYLDYSSFSNQGLYDQLLYEGFRESEAQYALDNLPE